MAGNNNDFSKSPWIVITGFVILIATFLIVNLFPFVTGAPNLPAFQQTQTDSAKASLAALVTTTIPSAIPPTLTHAATVRLASTNTPPPAPTTAPTLPPVPTVAPTQATPPACTAIGQTWTSPVDGITLVCVPVGRFMMGSAASDTDALDNERPQHEVSLSAFWIDKTEVTNRQFELFVKAKNYQTDAEKLGSGWTYDGSAWVDMKGAFWKQPKGPGSDLNGKSEHPVVLASWNDADAYCRWAGRVLPTEAQWEMAARGTDERLYPWGNAAPDANRANFSMNVGDTTQVGKYSSGASPYGALDMAGNVWEWVADWYNDTYYISSPASNPTGPSIGDANVLRGGGWISDDLTLRVSSRSNFDPAYRYYSLGFRCVAPPGK